MTLSILTPARRRGVEILDDPATPPDVRNAAMRDVVRSNALFGGTRAAIRSFGRIMRQVGDRPMLLDVGTGMGDIPADARSFAAESGVELTTVGVDVSADILRVAKPRLDGAVVGDAMRLPFSDNSADIVICSQVLHHFVEADARSVIAELQRVARRWVIVSDLRRSWLAAAGFWLASFTLRFHQVTRKDGVTSVLRGFTGAELSRLVEDATGRPPEIHLGIFWRITAVWRANP